MVPIPTTASGTSAMMALAAGSATGVRKVTSSTRTPPATSARASGTASASRSIVRTGMTQPDFSSAVSFSCFGVMVRPYGWILAQAIGLAAWPNAG